jgi:poly-gamma-glutamate capsule biosynthesis protein CapA/YwtB (metallophosphatase superfamily)
VTVLVLTVTGGRVVFDGDAPLETAASTRSSAALAATTTEAPRREATLVFGGDILVHSGVWDAAATGAGYDFSSMLAPIAPRLSEADVAICHLEVTLARAGEALSSYPRFRAPTELATDLAEAGFDGCSVASNHALDFGEPGVVATLDAMDAAGLAHAGTARAPEARQPAIYTADGIAVAHLSYAYGFNGFERPAGKEWLVDQIDPALILADARAARVAGAELVIVSMHWGDEYVHEVVAAQQTVADALAGDAGAVDLVVGHHAHVVQPISKVGSMWVVWGMGNLLSDNTPRCCTTEATDGVVVNVSIADMAPGGPVAVTGMTFTPTWNERDTHRVLPAEATLAAQTEEALTDQLQVSLDRTTAHILSLGANDLGVTRDP